MAALTLRSTKGSPLTNAEVDANFSALNTDVASRLLASAFTSSGIIAQLGFTPYDAANPAGYLSAITSAMIASALGFTPYDAANPSGFITGAGNAATATKLATARNINGVPFDGSASITVADATKLPLAGGITTGTITAAVAEALRITNDAGMLSGWDATDATRAGFLQFNKGANVVLMHEGAAGALALGGNGATRALVSGTGLSPAADNTYQLGSGGARWTSVNAMAGAFSTSLSTPTLTSPNLFLNRVGTPGAGVLWYSSNPSTNAAWVDYMAQPGTLQGPLQNLTAPSGALVTSWARRSHIENATGYGWTWESAAATSTAPALVAELRSSDGLFRPLGGLQLPGAKRLTFEANPTWSSQLLVGGDGTNGITRTASIASVVTTNGNLHLDAGTGRIVHLAFYSGTGVGFGTGAGAQAASMDAAGQLWKGATFGAGDRYATLGQAQGWTGQQEFRSNKGSGVTLGSTNNATLVVGSSDGGAAFLSFLRDGAYGVNMGLDPDNVLRIGGWSAPANVLQLDMSGNLTALGSVTGNRIVTGYDSGVAGSVNASNWFRSSGLTGLYFASYGCGVTGPQGDYGSVGTYSYTGSSGWAGYSINGGPVFMHNNSSSGSWGIYNDYNNTWMLQSDMSGNVTFTGNVTAYSDERLKRDWQDLPEDFIEQVAGMRHGTYERIDIGGRHAGASAQQWQRLLPEVVQEVAGGAEEGGAAHLTLAYGNAALVTCMALARRLIAAEARLAALEAA